MDALSKVFAVIVTIIAIFIVPVVNLANSHDDIVQPTVYSATTEFVEDVREQGKLTQDMYISFVQKLDDTGLLYDIEMVHSHDTAVPEFDDAGKTVGVKEVENLIYTDEILKSVYETNGIYKFNKGDYFSVKVTNKEATLGQQMRRTVFRMSDSGARIVAQHGGVIRDENY